MSSGVKQGGAMQSFYLNPQNRDSRPLLEEVPSGTQAVNQATFYGKKLTYKSNSIKKPVSGAQVPQNFNV